MTAIPGDNDRDNYQAVDLGANARARLKSFFERVERIDQERDDLLADKREVLAEAKGEGFDPRIIRAVIRLRKQDAAKRAETEALVELYLSAVGEG